MPHLSVTPPPTADPVLWRLANASHAMGHPSRLALLQILALEGRAPLETLEERSGLSNPTVRQHLKLLRRAGVVEQDGSLPSQGTRGRRRHTFGLNEDRVLVVHDELDAFLRQIRT